MPGAGDLSSSDTERLKCLTRPLFTERHILDFPSTINECVTDSSFIDCQSLCADRTTAKFSANKMSPADAGRIRIKRRMWCFAHCSTYCEYSGDFGARFKMGVARLHFPALEVCAEGIQFANIMSRTVPIAFSDGCRLAWWNYRCSSSPAMRSLPGPMQAA